MVLVTYQDQNAGEKLVGEKPAIWNIFFFPDSKDK
jgi:hypothetical protein